MALEDRKRKALETWLDNPLLDYSEIAEKAGIPVRTFYDYRHNEAFMAEYRKRCRERFSGLEAKAIEVLENKLNEEDWRACQYVLDSLDYGARQKIDAQCATTITINVEGDDVASLTDVDGTLQAGDRG